MLKAVIYARYSSEKQNEQSIEGQIHECEQFARTHDMVVVNHYIDRALSGKTDDRPSFLQMIKDSATGSFDAVLVYKTDRFARNRYDSAVYKAKLKKNGIKIFMPKRISLTDRKVLYWNPCLKVLLNTIVLNSARK